MAGVPMDAQVQVYPVLQQELDFVFQTMQEPIKTIIHISRKCSIGSIQRVWRALG